MKSKKALKHLTKVETLLSDVLAKYTPIEDQLRGMLSAAKASVVSATDLIDKLANEEGPSSQASISKEDADTKEKSLPASQEKTAPAKKKSAAQAPSANAGARTAQSSGQRKKGRSKTHATKAILED